MKSVIRKKNKTRFDYIVRTIGIFSMSILIFTMCFIMPSSKTLKSENLALEKENTNLTNYNCDLNREYNELRKTIKNTDK